MAIGRNRDEELISKYQWAGKIRFITFFLLLLFLYAMKLVGGYSYLNTTLLGLVIVGAVFNQPYSFLLRHVNVYRFQFYQMATDIIVVSWILYYLGGVEAPLISIAYYIIILWAGVVSGVAAVFFATIVSSIFFVGVVLFEYWQLIPAVSYLEVSISGPKLYSLLLGNVSFIFAFGYFSAYSSKVVQRLQRFHYEEVLRSSHKLLATGYLASGIAHDVINHLVCIRGYTEMVQQRLKAKGSGISDDMNDEQLHKISSLQEKGTELLAKLSRFSQKVSEDFCEVDISKVIVDTLSLTEPLLRCSKVKIEKMIEPMMPPVLGDKDQIQEIIIALILYSVENVKERHVVIITAHSLKQANCIEILFFDSEIEVKKNILSRISEPFFTIDTSERELEVGLSVIREIVLHHKGEITQIPGTKGKGSTFIIQLPIATKADAK